jgi:hypothetical protein
MRKIGITQRYVYKTTLLCIGLYITAFEYYASLAALEQRTKEMVAQACKGHQMTNVEYGGCYV